MMTLTTREWGAGELRNGRPGERSARLDNEALAELVLEAVRSVDEKKLHPPAPSSPGPGHGSRFLLATVEAVFAARLRVCLSARCSSTRWTRMTEWEAREFHEDKLHTPHAARFMAGAH